MPSGIVLECVVYPHFVPLSFASGFGASCYSSASDLFHGIACRYATNGYLKQKLEEFGKLSEKLVASYGGARLPSSQWHHVQQPQGSEFLMTKRW